MFPDTSQLIIFLTATLILNLTPGNDVLYVGSQSLHSIKHGVMATIGISTGIAIYAISSAFGLSRILIESPILFNTIKIIGAAYLFYLAIHSWFLSKNQENNTSKSTTSLWKAYKNGVLTNLLNPKVGIFFVTFLPQFIDIQTGLIWLQLLTLGVCFVISGTLVNCFYVFLFAYFKNGFFSKRNTQKVFEKLTGLIFCILALKVLSTS